MYVYRHICISYFITNNIKIRYTYSNIKLIAYFNNKNIMFGKLVLYYLLLE